MLAVVAAITIAPKQVALRIEGLLRSLWSLCLDMPASASCRPHAPLDRRPLQ
jgi:hypothetical protein